MVNIEFIYVIYLLLCATLGYFIAKHIGLKSENKELKERVRNEKKPMSNVWLSSLSNNLPIIFDNQHGKEIKGKKYPDDFEAKEQMYVEKIRQLEKILADTEKRRTEAYALIANVYEFEQTYGRYNAGAIDISELGKELESTFREYFRREKLIKNEANKQDVNINTNRWLK